MRSIITISLLLASMTNYGMQQKNEVDQAFAIVLGTIGLIGAGGVVLYAYCLAQEPSDEDLARKYMQQYKNQQTVAENKILQQKKEMAAAEKKKQELARLKNHLSTLPDKSADIIGLEQWVSECLTR